MHVETVTILFTIFAFGPWLCVEGSAYHCVDWQGHEVAEGESFRSRVDPCETCTCERGTSVRCMAVRCAPPECSLVEEVEGECCQFHCPELADAPPTNINGTSYDPDKMRPDVMDSANLGLRLVAGTVTTVLVVALVLFMIHRLRQRRILIMMRRMHEEQGADDAVAYMSQFDHIDMGIEFPPYEDPPPPYTPPKPTDIPHGEAPPPYEPVSNNNHGEGGDQGHQPLIGNGIANGRPVQGNGSIGPMAQTLTRPAGGVMSPAGALMWQSLQGSVSHRHGDHIRNSDRQSIAENRRSDSLDSDSKPPEYEASEMVESDGGASASDEQPVSQQGQEEFVQSNPTNMSEPVMHNKLPNPHMHLIKKSDSIEIRRGNCSPRNSFITENGRRPTNQTTSNSCSPNSHDATRPSRADYTPDGACSSQGTNISSNENHNKDKSPRRPQDLPNSVDAILEVSPVRDSTPPMSGVREMEEGVESALSEGTPSTSSQCSTAVHSPVSPTQQQAIGRSASAHSQFSVCSETGEKKPPKLSLPLALSNDAQYPLSPLSCKQPGPVHPAIPHPGSNHKNKSARNTSREEGTPNGRSLPEMGISNDRSSRNAVPARAIPPRISYVDQNCNDVIPTASITPGSTASNNSPESPQLNRTTVKRSNSGRSSTSNRNGDSGEDSGHGSLRKVKHRRRRSRGSADGGEASPGVKSEMNGHISRAGQGLEQSKRSSKPRSMTDAKPYQQYGVVDEADLVLNSELRNGEGSPSKSNRYRSHSHEKYNGSQSRENSSERKRSGERKKNDHSLEPRKNDRSASRDRKKRNRSTSHERQKGLPSNVHDQIKKDSFKNTDRSLAHKRPSEKHHSNSSDISRDRMMSNKDSVQLMNGHAVETNDVRNKGNSRKQSDAVNGTTSMDRKRKRRVNEPRTQHPDQLVNAVYSNGHVEHVIVDPEQTDRRHLQDKPLKSSYRSNVDANRIAINGHKHIMPER